MAPSRPGAGASTVAAVGAAVAGLAWFLWNGGGEALPPTAVGWVLREGDAATHFLGWCFSRLSPLSLPLGAAPHYGEPLGTSVAMTDGVPLAAVLLRPAAPLLAPDFQYLGAWTALSFALQGFFGARLGAALGLRAVGQAAAGILLAVSPVLLRRVGHVGLTSQWLLLAMLALALRPAEDDRIARRSLVAAAVTCVVAAAIHPVLALQAAGIACAVAAAVVLQGGGRLLPALGTLVAIAVADGLVFALLGYGGAPLTARGFGYFSADLLTFVNPMGWSRLLPSWPVRTAGQWEGFAYLGVGGLALVAIAMIAWVAARPAVPWRRVGPLLAVATAFALFAVSSYVTLGGRKLFGTSELPPWAQPLVSPFRASGRFTWPLYYAALAGGIAGIATALRGRPRLVGPALLAAAALQVADVGTGRVRGHFAFAPAPRLDPWEAARTGYRHLALVPARLRNADGEGCRGEFGLREAALAYRAYRLGLGVNSGYMSRLDVPRARRACAALIEEIERAELRADTVYVPDPSWVEPLRRAGAVCGPLGGEEVCVTAGPLARAMPPGRR